MKKIFSLSALSFLAGCSLLSTKPDLPELAGIENPILVEKIWEENTLSGSSDLHLVMGVAIHHDTLFAGDVDGVLIALDPQSGDIKWKQKTDLPFSSGVAADENRLYVGTLSGELASFSSGNGTLLFRTKVGGEILSTPFALKEGALTKTSDGQITRVDATGQPVWHKQEMTPLLSLRAQAGPIAWDDKALVAGFSGKVKAYSLKDGHELYHIEVFSPHGRSDIERMVEVTNTPVEENGMLYVAVFHGGAAVLDAESGQVLFSREGSVLGIAPISSHTVVMSDENGNVEAWDMRKHTRLWQQTDLAIRMLTAPVVFNEYVVVADEAGFLHFLDKNTGEMKGRIEHNGKAILAKPLIYNNSLIVIDEKGTLAAFEVK